MYPDNAVLVRNICIDPITGKVMNKDKISASGSVHLHDVQMVHFAFGFSLFPPYFSF